MQSLTLIHPDGPQFVFEDLILTGFEYPTVINSIEDISGRNGALYINSKFGRRRLSWQGLLKEDVLVNRRSLERALRAGALKTLQFETCDGLALQVQVEVESLEMPYYLGRTKYLIEAVAPDYRFVGQTLHEFETTETVLHGGAQIPATIPMSLSSGSALANTINNLGSEYADPIFIIHGAGTNFIVRNQTTEEQFVLDYNLGTNDYIEVDVVNRTVLLNGLTSIYSSLEGSFWQLAPGVNTIGFNTIGDDGNTLLTIQYRDSYLGI